MTTRTEGARVLGIGSDFGERREYRERELLCVDSCSVRDVRKDSGCVRVVLRVERITKSVKLVVDELLDFGFAKGNFRSWWVELKWVSSGWICRTV